MHRHSPGSTRRLTLGAAKGHDAAEFVSGLRQACITPHVARKSRYFAIDRRTTRHEGYVLSLKHPKRIEEAFGWAKNRRRHGPNRLSRRRAGAIPLHSDDGRQRPRPAAPIVE